MTNRFPSTMVLYKDTFGCGGITVRNIPLTCDAEGFIEGPADLATEIEPHGFVRADLWFVKQEPAEKVRLAKMKQYGSYFDRLLTKADRERAAQAAKQAK